MHFPSLLYIRVYETTLDTATNTKNILVKQTSSQMLCTYIRTTTFKNAVVDDAKIKAWADSYSPFTVQEDYEPLEFNVHDIVNDITNTNANLDVKLDLINNKSKFEVEIFYPEFPKSTYNYKGIKCDWTVLYGVYYKPVRVDPNNPIAVPAGADREEVIKEHLTPKAVLTPFILLIPQTDKAMADIIISHCPPESIVKWDSSKKETDPLLAEDSGPLPIDPTGLHISKEDLSNIKSKTSDSKDEEMSLDDFAKKIEEEATK